MTEPEVRKLIAVLVGAFPTTKSTEATLQIYERMLVDLEYVVANAAVERLIATSKWMPSIAEIRDACTDLTIGDRRPGGDAWGEVLAAIKRYGSYRRPGQDFVFSEPVVAECVSAMGWDELCQSENMVADRARFIELYDTQASTARTRMLAGGLPALKRLQAARPDLPAGRDMPPSRARGVVTLAGAVRTLRLVPAEADPQESEPTTPYRRTLSRDNGY